TISTGIVSDDLDPSIIAVPLDVDERIEIGWIGLASVPLTGQAGRFVAEMRDVVAEFGVETLA
ncbi:LysR family transcriptional regulator, partial [Bacillus thuringiensis]|nr:LysR family transcriptional regulator [Bacillus thuringiensis]